MLTVAVLGPVEVRRDEDTIGLPAGKSTEVLVRLAVDAGVQVRADRLLEDLWGAAALDVGRNTLQSKVSQLRRALGEAGLIGSGTGGYVLKVERADVDALHVIDVATETTELLRSGQLATALTRSNQGLALFRGDAFVDAGDGEWLEPHRVRVDEVRLSLLQDNAAARVRLGTGGDVIGDLERLVRLYPLRENLWYWLMMALYRGGRQADALAAYTRVRRTMLDELGLQPGRDLQDLERRILDQDPGLVELPHQQPQADNAASSAPSAPSAPTAPSATPAPPAPGASGNLPGLSAPLVGRDDDVAELLRQVRGRRLVTVVGTPGVGKTRLAIEVARLANAAGGTWLARLDTVDAQSPLPQAVAELLNVSSEQALVERVSAADTLVLFDNCEHVVTGAADLIGRLLDANPDLHVLATSQLPLGLEGESVYSLEPLTVADSVQLFTGRAHQIRPRMIVDEAAATSIAALCQSLDGLPLAIELAAARVKSLSVQEISRRLDNRFGLLQDPTSRRPERRRALGAAIGWSYDLLFPDDQRGLLALSCFVGGAPLAAVEHVLDALAVPSSTAVDVVDRLVDRSLVHADITTHGDVRYRLLDSIRTFAAARLADSTFRQDAPAAHADWYADRAQECADTVRGPRQQGWVDFIRIERANIDAALAWSAEHQPLLGVRIANGFGWGWVVLGDGMMGAGRIRSALAAAGGTVPGQERTTALLLSGWLEASAGDLGRAEGDLDQAATGAADLESVELTADAQRHRAFLRLQQGRPVDALALAEQSVEADRLRGRTWEQAAGLLLAGYADIMLGEIGRAREAGSLALTLLEPIADSWGTVHGSAMLGAIAQAERDLGQAALHFSHAAETSQRLGFLGQAAFHLTRLGRVHQQSGDLRLAADTLAAAIAAADHDGDYRMKATASVNLARVLRQTEQEDSAIALLERTDQWYQRAGGGDGALLTQVLLASIGHPNASEHAQARLDALLQQAREAGDHQVEVLALDALARMSVQRDAATEARQFLDTADGVCGQHPTAVDDVDRIDAHMARRLLPTPS